MREADIAGDFFRSLVVKSAWLAPQREKGTISGHFREDGAVQSEADARAVAGDDSLEFEERRRWPEWARKLSDQVD